MIQHPILPAGLNSAAWAGDELNGAGVEDLRAPEFFDAPQVFLPGRTPEPIFADVDICFGSESRKAEVYPELRLVSAGLPEPERIVALECRDVTVRPEIRLVMVQPMRGETRISDERRETGVVQSPQETAA